MRLLMDCQATRGEPLGYALYEVLPTADKEQPNAQEQPAIPHRAPEARDMEPLLLASLDCLVSSPPPASSAVLLETAPVSVDLEGFLESVCIPHHDHQQQVRLH